MNEFTDKNIFSNDTIKQIIESKEWYVFKENDEFSWKESIELLAKIISKKIGNIDPKQLKEAIENSFDAEALSKVGTEYFIDCLSKIDPKLIIWSEGDLDWQHLKALKTGLSSRPGLKMEFTNEAKTTKLKDLIISLSNENESESKICVLVIDDKEKNLNYAKSLQEQIKETNISIKTFHLNLQNAETNPSACLAFITSIPEKHIRLIVDMDGVLINTNQVLSKIIPQKITSILNLQKAF